MININKLLKAQTDKLKQVVKEQAAQSKLNEISCKLNELGESKQQSGQPTLLTEANIEAYTQASIAYNEAREAGDVARMTTLSETLNYYVNSDSEFAQIDQPASLFHEEKTITRQKEAEVSAIQIALNEEMQKASGPSKLKQALTAFKDNVDKEHIYPITAVTQWTNELKLYNNMIDEIMQIVVNLESKTNTEWVTKVVDRFCRRINYGLALVRYYIVKALNDIWQQAKEMLGMLGPVIEIVASGNIFKVVGNIITWIKGVIKMFTKPFRLIINFMKDFYIYTPPLISEATELASKCLTVPPFIQQRVQSILNEQQNAVTSVSLESLNIEMKPIKIGDIIGNPPKKPVYADFSTNAEEYKKLTDAKNALQDTCSLDWGDLRNYVINSPIDSTTTVEIPWVEYENKLTDPNSIKDPELMPEYRMLKPQTIDWCTSMRAAEIIFGEKRAHGDKSIWGKKFDTSKYQLLRTFNATQFKNLLITVRGEQLYNGIINYYKGLDDVTLSTIQRQKLEDENRISYKFITAFAKIFPKIPDYLNTMRTNNKKLIELNKKIKDMQKSNLWK